MIFLILAIYLIPSMVAGARGHNNLGSVIATNVLLGWTILGWAIAMIWSLSKDVEGN